MNKYSRYTINLRNIIMIAIFFNILSKYQFLSLKFVIIAIVFSLIMLNEYLRFRYFYRELYPYLISLSIAFISSAWLMFTYDGFYFYAIIFEIGSNDVKGKISNIFIVSHIIVYICRLIYSVKDISTFFSVEFWRGNGIELLLRTSGYLIMLFTSMFIKVQIKERMRSRKLNNELKEANDKLKDYSERVEELTITKERGRVASEIHDSLGHSLTALIMHLDFLENVVDRDTEKTKEVIYKCQDLARDSMKGLRKAVYTLNEENKGKGLKNSINDLIDNFSSSGGVKISLNMEGAIEKTSPEIKNIIYRTIMEGLTNSIKHVKATKILIDVYEIKDGIKFKIEDNGNGCKEIIKGTGLSSIEKRISGVNGEVTFSSNENKGFLIDVYIPLKEAEVVI